MNGQLPPIEPRRFVFTACNKPILNKDSEEVARCNRERDHLDADCSWNAIRAALIQRVAELESQLNTPEVLDFVKAVQLEAAHQRERWPSEHDAGKTDADWFWLIGFLAGKALHGPGNDREKQLHRIVTVAAAAANWHAAKLGATNMRPGTETPPGEMP